MGLDGRKTTKPIPLWKSFSYAIAGLVSALRTERNIRIHLFAAFIAILLSFLFSISSMEWVCIIIAIGGTISLELINTAIERVVDLVTQDFHPLAKQAKDIAAAAVFVFSIVSAIIGMFIFLPKIINAFL
ncbi:diacylglycerol kinase family protein [Neobacillus terrae]|uniref:diacylglycerol kinase family protein n=1 Tax=Neobacillus terrae TaxID=3034837 RepID=UPI0014085B77|nr:diacylglycerol kinase family protein [Neobacillus terrae]NHM30356.1 diacylglycerol kinase family protein [Neobacillus terrae]